MNGTIANGRIVSLIRNATAKIAPRTTARQQGAGPHDAEPDDDVEQGQRDRWQVDPGRPGDVEDVREGGEQDGRHRADRRPDTPAQEADEEDRRHAAHRVDEVSGRDRVDPDQLLGDGDDHRPQRRVLQEDHAEDGDRAVAVDEIAADADVLGVVEGGV